MPPPFAVLAATAQLSDSALAQDVEIEARRTPRRDLLYGLLRREQAISTSAQPKRSEVSRILDLAQAAYGDLVGELVGRDDSLLDTARDGEWTLRDLLRHATAVELRYAAQIEYSATRAENDPIGIPPSLLPCDRLSPPEPRFAGTRTGGVIELLELLGRARASSDERLASIPDAALTRPSLWGTNRLDVRMRLHQVAAHLAETVIQMEKITSARGGEGRAILRRCCVARGMHERWSPEVVRTRLDQSYRALTR